MMRDERMDEQRMDGKNGYRAEYIQWLLACRELEGKERKRILQRFPDPEELFGASPDLWREMMPKKQAENFAEAIRRTGSTDGMRESMEKLEKDGILFAAFGQAGYPERLKEIPDPPLGIYCKGRFPDQKQLSVAVIGSRDCSEYGRHVAGELGRFLGERGIPVISGMARGIDGISQKAALEAGGESFGVLGCGVDICYPESNRLLYQTLAEHGGILSAYHPGMPPLAKNFPPRNRIVSGLAFAIVVVEAAVKSGTGITVSMALEQGREVYVVPGRITDRLSEGCNRLIGQGAAVYKDPDSFLEELQEAYFMQCMAPVPEKKAGKSSTQGDFPEEPDELWQVLDQTPRSVEEIRDLLKEEMTVQMCGIRLMELVLSGKAKQVSTGYFCRV